MTNPKPTPVMFCGQLLPRDSETYRIFKKQIDEDFLKKFDYAA